MRTPPDTRKTRRSPGGSYFRAGQALVSAAAARSSGWASLRLTAADDRTTIMPTATSEERSHDPDQHHDADPARQDGRVAGTGRFLRQGRPLRGRLPVLPVRP